VVSNLRMSCQAAVKAGDAQLGVFQKPHLTSSTHST
jgi:hypothetical protein